VEHSKWVNDRQAENEQRRQQMIRERKFELHMNTMANQNYSTRYIQEYKE
jgi:hypothetical protein